MFVRLLCFRCMDLLMSGIFIFQILIWTLAFNDEKKTSLNSNEMQLIFHLAIYFPHFFFPLLLISFFKALDCSFSFARDEVCASQYFSGRGFFSLSLLFHWKAAAFRCVHVCMHGQCRKKKEKSQHVVAPENWKTTTSKQNLSHTKKTI